MSGDPVPDVPLLAGMGGVNSSESQSVHFGRKGIILTREKNTKEMSSLAQTMGIEIVDIILQKGKPNSCLLYTSPSPRDRTRSRMPSSA